VFHEKIEKPKNHRFFIKFVLAYLIIAQDTVHIRIFIRTFHLITNRSDCAGFYWMNEGPQNTCVQ
jgi:hypothetical protein